MRRTIPRSVRPKYGWIHWIPRRPDVTFDMKLDDRRVDVIEEGFDVSVRIAESPDSSLTARRIAPCRHVVVAPPP